MTIEDIKKYDLPSSPGVYFFHSGKDKDSEILYIGRATSLRDRVKSYFSYDLIHTRGSRVVDMVTKSNFISWQTTNSVLEAIILEANLIKKYEPKANVKEKDNRSFAYIIIRDEEFPRVEIARGRDIDKGIYGKVRDTFGPYTSVSIARDVLKIIRKTFSFRDRCEPKKEGLTSKPCFNYQIGLCPGVCVGLISKTKYENNIRNIVTFLNGDTSGLLKKLEKEMMSLAHEQKFEEADVIKRKLYSLTHIEDITLIKREKNLISNFTNGFRIEAYDIAHTSGKEVVGVMTVVIDGEKTPSQYKKFKIKEDKNDDTKNLVEIIQRRLKHAEWGMPDLIVIDGGVGQKNAVEKALKEISADFKVVSLVKDDFHRPKEILSDKKWEDIVKEKEMDIVLANSESHRFAIDYHRKLRNKNFLKGLI